MNYAYCIYLDNDIIFDMLPNGTFQSWPFVTDLYTSNTTIRDELLLYEFDRWVREDTNIFVHDAIKLKYFGGKRRYGVVYTIPLVNQILRLSSTPYENILCGTRLNDYNKEVVDTGMY